MGRGASGKGTWSAEIDSAGYAGSGKYKRFDIPDIGGAAVDSGPVGKDGAAKMKWFATTWIYVADGGGQTRSVMAEVDGGKPFNSREEANRRAKEALKERVRKYRKEHNGS